MLNWIELFVFAGPKIMSSTSQTSNLHYFPTFSQQPNKNYYFTQQRKQNFKLETKMKRLPWKLHNYQSYLTAEANKRSVSSIQLTKQNKTKIESNEKRKKKKKDPWEKDGEKTHRGTSVRGVRCRGALPCSSPKQWLL